KRIAIILTAASAGLQDPRSFCFARLSLRLKIAHHRRRRIRKAQAKAFILSGTRRVRVSLMDDLRKFARYFRPYKWSLVIGVVCILASVVVGLIGPTIVRQAVDELSQGDVTWWKLSRSAFAYLGISAVSGVFLFLQRRILIGMSRHVEYDLRQHFYAHLQRQPLSLDRKSVV